MLFNTNINTGGIGVEGPQGPQGIQGEKGENGKDGYTPVKGIDYFDGVDGIDGKDGANYMEALTTNSIASNILTLTIDKFQYVEMQNNTTIMLPNVTTFTQIHLFFNATSDLTITCPSVKWQAEPSIKSGKAYEIVFTYVNQWLGGVISYG